MQDFKKLAVWQKAHILTLKIYEATSDFPREEQFGLTSQVRRAAASIPANIAEGCGRGSNAELSRFLHIAAGSASETEDHLFLARDLGHITDNTYDLLLQQVTEIKKMFAGLQKRLHSGSPLKIED